MTTDTALAPAPIHAAAQRVAHARAALDAAQKALASEVFATLAHLDGDAERELVSYLYWHVPSLATTFLTAAVGGSQARMRQLAGRGPVRGTSARTARRPCTQRRAPRCSHVLASAATPALARAGRGRARNWRPATPARPARTSMPGWTATRGRSGDALSPGPPCRHRRHGRVVMSALEGGYVAR